MTTLRIFLAVTAISVFAGQSVAGGDYFPLVEGNTWVYAYAETGLGGELRWEVVHRQDDTFVLSRPGQGPEAGELTLRDGGSDVELEAPGGGFVLFYRFEVGSTWVRHDPNVCDDDREVSVLAEPGPVVTPAGTFTDCLRIETREASDCVDAGTAIEWWARGVGLVRRLEANFSGSGGLMTLELQSYSLEESEAGVVDSRVLPADCNSDGEVDVSDGICLLGHLYLGAPARLPCGDGSAGDPANVQVLDSNGDGEIEISDAVYVFSYLYLGTAPPSQGTSCTSVATCPRVCFDSP